MATTGTVAFNPAVSALTMLAFGRIGIRRTEITVQHLEDAATEANLVQVAINNNQPNLWVSEVYDITLIEGQAEYDLPPRLTAIQDIYMTTTPTGGTADTSTDRVLGTLSMFEYDAQANKLQQAPPTSYVVFKTLQPTIKFWQVPDGNATYVAHVRMLSRPEDASLRNGYTLDAPYTYLDVFVAGLAHRMARIYARDQEMMRKQDYMEALAIAQNTDTQDNVGMYIQPDFSVYNR